MAVTLTNLCQDRDRHQLVHLVNFRSLHYVYKHQWKEKMILESQEGIHGEGGVLGICLIKAYCKGDVF